MYLLTYFTTSGDWWCDLCSRWKSPVMFQPYLYSGKVVGVRSYFIVVGRLWFNTILSVSRWSIIKNASVAPSLPKIDEKAHKMPLLSQCAAPFVKVNGSTTHYFHFSRKGLIEWNFNLIESFWMVKCHSYYKCNNRGWRQHLWKDS